MYIPSASAKICSHDLEIYSFNSRTIIQSFFPQNTDIQIIKYLLFIFKFKRKQEIQNILMKQNMSSISSLSQWYIAIP